MQNEINNLVPRFTSAVTAGPTFLFISSHCSHHPCKQKIPLLWQLSEVLVYAVTGESYSLFTFLLKPNNQHGLAQPLDKQIVVGTAALSLSFLYLEYVWLSLVSAVCLIFPVTSQRKLRQDLNVSNNTQTSVATLKIYSLFLPVFFYFKCKKWFGLEFNCPWL